LTSLALLAGLDSNIKILIIGTRRASFSIKNRFFCRASLAFLSGGKIDKVLLAAFTELQLVVKMLRKITSYTLFVCLERFVYRAFTSFKYMIVLFSFLTIDALLAKWIEEL
jgi:hypothetical protein